MRSETSAPSAPTRKLEYEMLRVWARASVAPQERDQGETRESQRGAAIAATDSRPRDRERGPHAARR